jgi:hypothetical protein
MVHKKIHKKTDRHKIFCEKSIIKIEHAVVFLKYGSKKLIYMARL